MLSKVTLLGQLDQGQGCVLLLGGFDGLHIGHRRLVERAKEYGLPIGAMTILGGKDGQGLFTLDERMTIFQDSGVDFAFKLDFLKIKDLTPTEFVGLLLKNFDVKAFVCGDDFRFGKCALGTPETLKEVGRVRVEVEELVQVGGEKVSSSVIKGLLEQGEIEAANILLGERFFLLGNVVKDRQVGRTIGFPTANIVYPNEKFPLKTGVYESRVTVDGKEYKGITNYGARPTFDDSTVCTETYLDGFNGDLYGRKLRVEFARRLRDICKFEDVEALQKQLTEDIGRVRNHD